MSTFTLPEIGFAYDALAPYIGAETMELHHSKHHQTYVTNLNNLIVGSEFEGQSLEAIVAKSSGPIFNNAGQHWNHCQFWKMIGPAKGGEPTGNLMDAIKRDFGSFDDFKTKFEQTGLGTFGSGWAWLVKTSAGNLELLSTSNADNPLRHNQTALLGVDVWEHAYYVDYRNRRPDYLKALWNVVDWDNVASRL